MEDEVGVKAPVTRLRRRLSVEQTEDARSSPAPNTPTKKRGGRRVAKPELDLIDENAPENDTSKKVTKKANMKELDIEEKPVTPSRRSARIKSNTSIVLETTQTVDSPRAKRATRRTSQAGSDNEAPITPARITRRTRRDSSNADKAEPQPANKPVVPVTEIIVEEPEPSQKVQSSSEKPDEKNQSTSSKRKSPRLSLKRNDKSSDSTELNGKVKHKSEKLKVNKSADSSEVNEKELNESEEHNNSNKENEISEMKAKLKNLSPVVCVIDISNNLNEDDNNGLSISNIELLDKLNTESIKKNKNANKSYSTLTEPHTESFKNKRHRTKSWTGLSEPMQDDNKCYSDSESTKKTKKASLGTVSNIVPKNVSKNIEDDLNVSANEKVQNVRDVTIKEAEIISIDSPSNTEKILGTSMNKSVTSTNMFDKEPSNDLQTLVYIEESDSNSENIKSDKQRNDEEQGVSLSLTPFGSKVTPSKNETTLNNSQNNDEHFTVNKNDSCEPMDVDETLPDNVVANKSLLKTLDTTESKVSSNANDDMNSSSNEKEKSRSSLTFSTSQNLDKTTNENKSTLVLSQLKDISNENNEISQSPQISIEKNSKSDQAENFIQDNPKKELTSNYLTSTPLQQKNIKHAIQVNTSGINSNNASKIDVGSPKINVPDTDQSNNKSEESDSGDESSQEENNFIDAEAEEASDDYESGDSRDDEEVQYEKENEIIQKGETLTSEEDLSNDSDYEKDSFIVSSDQEDDDLLDGSGDDLSMSDNELKMTKESKKKYNERKSKEQKKASREMFESRHKLNDSNNSDKSNLIKKKKSRAILDSSASEDENITVKAKKNKRMLLDSSHEENSISNSLDNASTAKLSNSLSKLPKDDTNEVEMTIVEEDIKNEIDPLSINIKKELNTPQKEMNYIPIKFIDPESSEEQGVNSNKSHLNMTVADDPLEEETASESSDSSDNVHIQNYDSILNDLNNSIKTKKNKKCDISLNIDKKTKQKSEPIVDQLNLTQIKSKDKKKTKVVVDSGETSENVKSKKESNKSIDQSHEQKQTNKILNISSKKSVSKKKSNDEESGNESSASIDLRLSFSEDSNNSEDVKMKNKKAEQINEDDNFIPLKKSHGKTNILEISGSQNKSQTESAKKMKKKTIPLDKTDVENENSVDGTELQFFLDTTGTHNSTAVDQPMNASAAKKQKDKQEQSIIDDTDSVPDTPIEMSVDALNKSKTKTPKSDKKKQRKESLAKAKEQTDSEESQSIKPNQSIQEDIEMQNNQSVMADKSINKSVTKTPKSEKKKAKMMIESEPPGQEEENSDTDAPTEIANKSVMEKLKQQIDAEELINTSLAVTNKSMTKTPKSDKKKKRTSEPESKDQTGVLEIQRVIEDDMETNVNLSAIANKSIDKSIFKTPKSDKKKAKRSESPTRDKEVSLIEAQDEKNDTKEVMNTSLVGQNISITKTPKSDKKKKKRMSESQKAEQTDEQVSAAESINANNKNAIEEQGINEPEAEDNETGSQNKSGNKSIIKTPKSEKKKKKLSESLPEIPLGTNETSTKTSSEKKTQKMKQSNNAINIENLPESKDVGSKKRKRKSSLNQIEKEPESEELVPRVSKPNVNVSTPTISQSKKRKISHNVEDSESIEQDPITNTKVSAIKKQQNQGSLKQRNQLENQTNNTRDTTDVNLNNKKVMKKRKEREDDEGSRMAKVLKCETNDKTPVPRLPASVLDQLQEGPAKKTHQVTKPKAISTTNFVVENAKVKRTKPSNYLEESIYINEEEDGESRKPKYIKNPKVLPFLPTVSTSNSGYTTNFKVNILPKEIQFVAKSTSISNYKNDYLQNKRVKRLGTYELYKRNRNIKMSKF